MAEEHGQIQLQWRWEPKASVMGQCFLVGEWPDLALAAPEFLSTASAFVKVEPGVGFRFTLANGEAVYRAIAASPHLPCGPYVELRKVWATKDGA
jgi:hypothetical protein